MCDQGGIFLYFLLHIRAVIEQVSYDWSKGAENHNPSQQPRNYILLHPTQVILGIRISYGCASGLLCIMNTFTSDNYNSHFYTQLCSNEMQIADSHHAILLRVLKWTNLLTWFFLLTGLWSKSKSASCRQWKEINMNYDVLVLQRCCV